MICTPSQRIWTATHLTMITDAVADAGAATVNATSAPASETDNCEVCLVAQREPRLALVSFAAISDFANHVFVTWKV